MEPITISLLLILFSIIVYLWYEQKKLHRFWIDKGIPQVDPLPFVGNSLPLFLQQQTPGELHKTFCEQYPNEPIIGFYDLNKPTLIVRDLDYVEKVFIKDFTHFVDHGFPLDEDISPLDSNLFGMTGKRWKATRNKLSPIFTSGKLKNMYGCMAACGNELIKQMDKMTDQDVDLKEILGCFAMDSIGSCVFGIEPGNLADPDNEFRRIGKKALKLDPITWIKFLIFAYYPRLRRLFRLTFSKPEVMNYFAKIVRDTLKYRRENGFVRNDFIQMLMQLQDKGYVELHTKDASDDYLQIDTDGYTTEKFELSDEQLTGHAAGFLTAGFDATTATILFTMYELAKNPDVQQKVRDEVLKVVKIEGDLTYDALKSMTYLEQCVKETLRMYPPPPMLLRMCTKEYTFPNGKTIQPGQQLVIPLPTIHYDPKYYPEPMQFKPERFEPSNFNKLPSCAFVPFGNGPRICIGMRFALLEINFCIAKLLMNYNIKPSPKTMDPIVLSKRDLITLPKKPLYFIISKLKA